MQKEYVVLGATGHVGGVVARTLLGRGERVVAIARDARRAEDLARRGAEVAVVDARDESALREVLRRGRRLFLLNPPAPPSTDAAAEEREGVAAILEAVKGSGLERIVALSVYGAQPGGRIGDLGVLYEMERALAALPIPSGALRAAYYMSNWDAALESARKEGVVHTLYPPDFRLPMVAPEDLGRVAADLLTAEDAPPAATYVEGPARYSSADVATAFGAALARSVRAVETPRTEWESTLRGMGFSEASTESFVAMTALTLEGPEEPPAPVRGQVTLEEYVRRLVASSQAA